MITNTITTIKLEAEEGKLISNNKNRLIYGKVIFTPLSSLSEYEELEEAEVLKLAEEAKQEEQAEQEEKNQEEQEFQEDLK